MKPKIRRNTKPPWAMSKRLLMVEYKASAAFIPGASCRLVLISMCFIVETSTGSKDRKHLPIGPLVLVPAPLVDTT